MKTIESLIGSPKAYFVGGVNGVGKSTFLAEVSTKHPEFRVVKGSSAFMKWLNLEPGDYDSLRVLPDGYKRIELDRMMNDLLSKPSTDGKIMLIDAHYFHYKRGEMVDTTGEWLSVLDAMFVVTGDTEEVLNRIAKDSKDRDLFPREASFEEQRVLLEKYLKKTIQKAREMSERHGVPFFVLNNAERNMEETIRTFLDAHAGIINEQK
ncbi:hypothetical protein C4578_02435 [Candidatus Microgenomates bacterium]|jgi:adenylate kinase|nr:MAG: hypothetical protein C4578_02435 [Candidatus Microgenomates bacterium]